MAGDDAIPVYFDQPRLIGSGREQWGLRVPRSGLQSLLDQPQIELAETSSAANGRRIQQTIKLSNEGWADALALLLAACPPVKGSTELQTARPDDATSK